MAQKKAYSRYFIILQQDENGYSLASDKLPSGYTKLETKNDKCKISYYVQNLKKEHEPYYMALICNKKDAKKLIKLGMMNIDDYGRAEITHEYSVDNVAGSNISVDMVTGAAIVKFVDTNIISVMSGFSTTDIPSDWKGFKVIEVTRQLEESNENVSEDKSEPKDVKKEKVEVIAEVIKEDSREDKQEEKNIFEEYEKKIEEVKETAPIEEIREKIREEIREELRREIIEEVRKEVIDENKDKVVEEADNRNEVKEESVVKEELPVKEEVLVREEKLEEENKINTKEESDEERVEESTEENRIEVVEETAQRLEGTTDKIEEPAERVEENFQNIEEPIKIEETLEERAEIKEQEEDELKAEENIQSNIIDSDEVRDKHKCKHEDKEKHDDHKCKHEDKEKYDDHECKHEDKEKHDDHECKHEGKDKHDDHMCKYEDKDKHDDHKCKHEEKSEYHDHKCDHYCHKDYYDEYKQDYDPEHDCPKGTLGDFFKALAEEFEEVKDACKEIKKCKWYKVPIKNLDELCNQTNYNKYTVVYYPMISYYPYIKNHGYYLLGYKYDSTGKMKYLVYGIPGKKKKTEQPYGGKSGFVTWVPVKPGEEREDDMGHWLMFYDFRTSTIVIPMK